jgi:hypothetical protein
MNTTGKIARVSFSSNSLKTEDPLKGHRKYRFHKFSPYFFSITKKKKMMKTFFYIYLLFHISLTAVNGQQSKMAEYLSKDLTNQQILQRDPVTNKATVVFKAGNKVSYKIGGPYTISGKKDIYVGDIWVMAGQSNMRGHGFLKNAFRQDEPEKVLNHVHLFDSTEKWRVNSDPSHQLYLSNRTVHRTLPDPTVKNPEIAKFRGASIGPSFGANYESGIPLG